MLKEALDQQALMFKKQLDTVISSLKQKEEGNTLVVLEKILSMSQVLDSSFEPTPEKRLENP